MRGLAPLGRLIALAMITAGLGTVAVATVETAHAATSDSPTAVGVSSSGTTYVGFASGGKLQRISASGKLKGGVPLDQDEAVDGLFVAENGDIWVDYETSVSRLSPKGRVLTHFDHQPLRSCGSSSPPHRYGGITANGNRVYVANRCDDTMSVYSRTGDLIATVNLPGNGHPRGITYGNPQAGRPAMVYVALPDRGQIVSYKAARLHGSSKPASRFTLHRPAGGSKPQPGGLAVDKWGQLTATDMANHALYLLDTNHNYSLYRTLGHPPRAGRAAGRLNYPTAIAQHDQDGGGMSGDLFIADTNNNRVQRWNTSGYTYWVRGVRAGGGGGGDDGGGGAGVPRMTSPPEISGTPQVGEQLTCFVGSWEGNPTSFERGWTRDGAVISGARGTTYTVADVDDGTRIACRVRAKNSHGTSRWASSDPVTIGGSSGDGPTNTSPPVITGNAAVGSVLSCSTGSWSGGGGPAGGSITYAFQWRRDGGAISGATSTTYTVVAADDGAAITCTVTATNAQGSTQATSAPVTIGGGGAGPTNTSPPVITGSAVVGGVLSCSTGGWSDGGGGPSGGSLTYAYQWKRNGTAIASATSATYTVVAADNGTTLTCMVTASNSQGSTQATSAGVTIGGGAGPTNSSPPVISGTPAVGQVLTCSTGTWTGSDGGPAGSISFAFQWKRNGAAIASATSSSYPVVAADQGKTITCVVTATNADGSTEAVSAGVVIGGGAGPTNSSPPVITGTPVVGGVLSCSTGTWTGSDGGPTGAISYAFQWKRNGTAIASATSSSYTVVAADQGKTITCMVTATNADGSTDATSAGVVVGGGAGPVNTSLPVITGTAAVGGVLSCSTGTWTGSGGGPTGSISFAFQWKRDGVAIGSANSSSYTVVAADQGKTITCVVTATNADGSTEATSAGALVGGGAGPTNTSLPVITGTPTVGQVLSCSTGTWTGSGGGPTGSISYAFQWKRNGTAIGSASSSSYPVVAADQGKTITCVVTATNAGGSTEATSVGVVVGGAGPTNTSLPVITGTPTVGQVLSCSTGTWTGSGGGPAGSISYAFEWKRDGSPIGSATSSYTVVAADDGKALTCVVTATNAEGSTQATSAPVTIGGGAAPVNTVLPYLSGSSNIGERLTCNPGTWTGSGITYTYQWKRNTSAIPLATWPSYTVLSEDVGTTLTCTVTATNGQGSAQAVSAGVGISGPSGHAPGNTSAPFITGTPAVGQPLTCDPGTWVGSPELVYSYQWQRNGADITGATSAVYTPVNADSGASLRCVVVVANGYGKGAVASSLVTISGGGGGACAGPVGVTINGGAATTTSRNVTLTVCPPPGAVTFEVSNDSGFAGAKTFSVAPSGVYDWVMPSIPGSPLAWPVYVRFDNDPTVYWDSIVVNEPVTRPAGVAGW